MDFMTLLFTIVVFCITALTMSISMACLHNKEPIGMSGVDLHMEDLVQDITYFNQADSSYAFIINTNGRLHNFREIFCCMQKPFFFEAVAE